MNKLIDAALGVHPHALQLGASRMEVLAANMANADTPGFKARDVDFRGVLQGMMNGENGAAPLRATHARHAAPGSGLNPGELKYRVPVHPALDGNTVDAQLEQAAFADAAVRYQASLDFLSARVDGLRKALRGE